jgi:DNA-binding transcriptional regulator GbsR (MarR family)
MTDTTQELSPAVAKFIVHWGEMGSRWGINRTMAQIHALLYVSEEPLTAEAIAETLSVARSNVSTSIRELQSWGLVRVVHVLGDRRDHFQALTDVWEMFRIILAERKRREVDPTLERLRDCMEESERSGETHPYAQERLRELLSFFELTGEWYEQVYRLPRRTLMALVKMGSRIAEVVDRRR